MSFILPLCQGPVNRLHHESRETGPAQRGGNLGRAGRCIEQPAVAHYNNWEHPRRGRLVFWDAQTGKPLHVVRHADAVLAVAFSPDGGQLVTASWDKTAALWDTATGRQLCSFEGHSGLVGAVAFSSDGRLILVIDADGAALWDTKSLEKVRDLQGYSGVADFVLFSPSGQVALIAMNGDSGSGRLWFWDVASGRKLSVIGKEQRPGVTCGVFFPDGKQVLLGATDGKARLWDIASGKCVQQFHSHQILRNMAVLPGLKQAMTDSGDALPSLGHCHGRRVGPGVALRVRRAGSPSRRRGLPMARRSCWTAPLPRRGADAAVQSGASGVPPAGPASRGA